MDALQEEMTAEQWREWLDFFDLEPTGNVHVDMLWGMLLALIENVNKARGAPTKPSDILPYLAESKLGPEEMTEVDVIEKNMRWRAAAIASRGQVIEATNGAT